eukprot:Rmarinus@m.8855
MYTEGFCCTVNHISGVDVCSLRVTCTTVLGARVCQMVRSASVSLRTGIGMRGCGVTEVITGEASSRTITETPFKVSGRMTSDTELGCLSLLLEIDTMRSGSMTCVSVAGVVWLVAPVLLVRFRRWKTLRRTPPPRIRTNPRVLAGTIHAHTLLPRVLQPLLQHLHQAAVQAAPSPGLPPQDTLLDQIHHETEARPSEVGQLDGGQASQTSAASRTARPPLRRPTHSPTCRPTRTHNTPPTNLFASAHVWVFACHYRRMTAERPSARAAPPGECLRHCRETTLTYCGIRISPGRIVCPGKAVSVPGTSRAVGIPTSGSEKVAPPRPPGNIGARDGNLPICFGLRNTTVAWLTGLIDIRALFEFLRC